MTVKIHPTALVDSSAQLGVDVEIGPFAVIGPQVILGDRSKVASHCCLEHIHMKEENQIGSHCVLGGLPQIPGDSGKGLVLVGAKNSIREGCHIHRGSDRDEGKTILGDRNFIMSQVHIAHDVVIEDDVVIASLAGIAGHVRVDHHALLSGLVGVAQRVRIGAYAYTAGMTRIKSDLPPYHCAKEFSELMSPNFVGLKRNGFSEEDIKMVKELSRVYFPRKKALVDPQKIQDLEERYNQNEKYLYFVRFLKESVVGVMSRP